MSNEQPSQTTEQEALRAYCMKCKCVRTIAHALTIILPSGKPAVKGVCPICGIKLLRSWRPGM